MRAFAKRTTIAILCALALLLVSRAGAAQAPSSSSIVRDETVGGPGQPTPVPDGDGLLFEVGEGFGEASGQNLYHSFDRLDLAEPDTLRFSADPGSTFRNLIARVTGSRSLLYGRLESTIANADFYLINPRGVVFGPNASIDVPAAFTISSADEVVFRDGLALGTQALSPAALSPVDPVAFGFFDASVGALEVQGTLEVGPEHAFRWIGGDVTLEGGQAPSGGVISAIGGDITLVSVASAGSVVFDPDAPDQPPRLSAFAELGEIRIVDDAVLSSSGLSPLLRDLNTLDPESQLIRVTSMASPTGAIPDGATLLSDSVLPNGTRQVVYYTVNPDAPALHRGAGRITIRAQDLTIEDSDIRAETVGTTAEEIDLQLSGTLEIRKQAREADVGILATSGRVAQGFLQRAVPGAPGSGCEGAAVGCRVIESRVSPLGNPFDLVEFGPIDVDLTSTTGTGSAIRVAARDIRLEDGARITTTSLNRGAPGSITIDASGDVSLTGSDPFALDEPNVIQSSAIASNHQGTPGTLEAFAGGDIQIDARSLVLEDGGGVFAQTAGDGNAGDIVVNVEDLVVRDDSQIDSSTSGQLLGANPGGETTSGEGGTITVHATGQVLLEGRRSDSEFARLSTFSQRNSVGGAGTITLSSPKILIRDGAGIAVTTEGEGSGGSIRIDAGRFEIRDAARLSASSESRVDPAGNIEIATTGTVIVDQGAEIAANTGISLGGNIQIDSGDVMLAGQQTSIRADAQIPGGSGGSVTIDAPLLVRSASARITADAPGGPEFQGTVEIRSPVVDLESGVLPPPIEYLDASSLLLSRCSARRSGERAGSFQVSRWPGLPTSYDGPLVAFGDLDPWSEVVPAASSPRESPPPPAAESQLASVTDSWPNRLRAGRTALRIGHFSQANERFREAIALMDPDVSRGRVEALRGIGRASQMAGDFDAALPALERAAVLARASDDPARLAASLGDLGVAHVALRDLDRAESLFERALAEARRSGDESALAVALNQVGTLYAVRGQPGRAFESFSESASAARAVGRVRLESQALANAARAALVDDQPARSMQMLDRAFLGLAAIPDGIDAIAARIHLAESYARAAAASPKWRVGALTRAHRLLMDASAAAGAIGDARIRSRALGTLGALYAEEEAREDEALYLTRRAIRAAETAAAPDLIARWAAQAGRLHRQAGRTSSAITAFRRAVSLLEEVRLETRPRLGGVDTSFRAAIAPVYLGLIDALLAASIENEDEDERQTWLVEARDTVERWKSAELRDYFRDDCIAELEARARPLEALSEQAAVVYPIVLGDRLELLVSTRQRIVRYAVAVDRGSLRDTVHAFRDGLETRTSYRFRAPAEQLFDWLVRPFVVDLEAQGIDTLVVVPDGVLRTIPFSALHDGERFLVERYAVAVAPTIRLIAPRSLDPGAERLLIAGLAEPVQGFAPLENVRDEVGAVRALYGGSVLMDAAFRSERLETELRERPPAVVHLASHAGFTGDPDTSFVLAHDRRVPIGELAGWIEANRFGSEPLELLVLSACETAAGNDRAALGLAGLAIRAGARSVLGSLWSVNDEATSRLIVSFYQELGRPDTSKVEALARGQRALIADRKFDHPFYWAGFLMLNNWL